MQQTGKWGERGSELRYAWVCKYPRGGRQDADPVIRAQSTLFYCPGRISARAAPQGKVLFPRFGNEHMRREFQVLRSPIS